MHRLLVDLSAGHTHIEDRGGNIDHFCVILRPNPLRRPKSGVQQNVHIVFTDLKFIRIQRIHIRKTAETDIVRSITGECFHLRISTGSGRIAVPGSAQSNVRRIPFRSSPFPDVADHLNHAISRRRRAESSDGDRQRVLIFGMDIGPPVGTDDIHR